MDDNRLTVAKMLGFASYDRYAARCKFIFAGLPLRGSRVLDVGCGRGPLAIWAALQGASGVLGIEPESDGSRGGTLSTFRRLVKQLGLSNIQASAARLEDLDPGERFDVIVLYNVINHIDEDAVQALHIAPDARARFVSLAQSLRQRLSPGGVLVLADCGRSNLWAALHIPSPFAPTITWRKHQDPPVWIDVFRQAGFRLRDLRWSPLYPFQRLTANHTAQWLTGSHFVLRMQV